MNRRTIICISLAGLAVSLSSSARAQACSDCPNFYERSLNYFFGSNISITPISGESNWDSTASDLSVRNLYAHVHQVVTGGTNECPTTPHDVRAARTITLVPPPGNSADYMALPTSSSYKYVHADVYDVARDSIRTHDGGESGSKTSIKYYGEKSSLMGYTSHRHAGVTTFDLEKRPDDSSPIGKVRVRIGYQLSSSAIEQLLCSEGPECDVGPDEIGAPPPMYAFVRFSVTASGQSGPPTSKYLATGSGIFSPSGFSELKGIFASAGFQSGSGCGLTWETLGDLSDVELVNTIYPNGPTRIVVQRLSQITLLFERGLVNFGPTATWSDRAIIESLVGVDSTADEDELYEPRADWDWDGVIESSDLDAFDRALCLIDLDESGECDLGDLFAFLNWFDVEDPSADLTADTVVDLADYFLFLELFDKGCDA